MAEYLVSRDDALHQMVDELDTADGAGNLHYNWRDINIEHEGFSGQPLTPAQIKTSAGLHQRIAARYTARSTARHWTRGKGSRDVERRE